MANEPLSLTRDTSVAHPEKPVIVTLRRHASVLALLAVLAGPPAMALDKADAPVPAATLATMTAKDMAPGAPVLVRTFKKEAVLEIWKQTRAGRYALLKTFPICRWSGQLGPKQRTGDRQTPEGFYAVAQKQLNPNSHYYLSFDVGFPNAYDRAHGATGAYLMVHGTCSSAGCYAMTDKQVAEIYALVRDALTAGQSAFQFQAFPFRMTAENMALHRSDAHIAFWRQLKEGSDRFEATGEEPLVSVSGGRYVFTSRTPTAEAKVAERRRTEDERMKALVSDGLGTIRTTYADGGQHAIFAAMLRKGENLGDVSRPEALAYAGKEVVLTPTRKVLAIAKPVEPPAPIVKFNTPMTGSSPILDASLTPLPNGATLIASVARVRVVAR